MTKNNKAENWSIFHKIQKRYENWKRKAVEYNKELILCRRRIKDLIEGRDYWRSKYYAEKADHEELKQSVTQAKNVSCEKVKDHSYSLETILFVIWLRSSSTISLRGVIKVLEVFNKVFNFDLEIPCKSSIQNWEKKHSLYRLEMVKMAIEASTDETWCVIIDESISIGEEKILLVLGVPLSVYEFDKPLDFKNIKVLQIKISKSWKATDISLVLNDLKSNGYDIKYVVSDSCPTLKCAINESEIPRVSDCTHAFGNILKSEYEKSEEYKSFDKACGKLKKATNIGLNAAISPPKYRKKGKFLNLKERAKWADLMLQLMTKNKSERDNILTKPMQKKLGFIKDYKVLIRQLHLQCETINSLHKELKNNGLSIESVNICRGILHDEYGKKMENLILESKNCNPQYTLKEDSFYLKIEQYFREELALLHTFDVSKIICSSDIIESMFGKYKERAKRSGSAITDDCLNMANFTENFSREETKKAMETVKIVDIVKWRKKNCKDSLRAKKQKLHKNVV